MFTIYITGNFDYVGGSDIRPVGGKGSFILAFGGRYTRKSTLEMTTVDNIKPPIHKGGLYSQFPFPELQGLDVPSGPSGGGEWRGLLGTQIPRVSLPLLSSLCPFMWTSQPCPPPAAGLEKKAISIGLGCLGRSILL